MSNMSSLIEVFSMSKLSHETRIRVITKLGRAINNELGGNYTEEIVEELVGILKQEIKDIEEAEKSLEGIY